MFQALDDRMNFSDNAKFALVIADFPTGFDPEKIGQWSDFLGNARTPFLQGENKQTIHDNVWLIPLDSDTLFLARLVNRSHEKGIPLKILLLDASPNWIKHPPDAVK